MKAKKMTKFLKVRRVYEMTMEEWILAQFYIETLGEIQLDLY